MQLYLLMPYKVMAWDAFNWGTTLHFLHTFVHEEGYSLLFSSHFNRKAYFRHCYVVSPHFPHCSVNTLAIKLKTHAYEPVHMLFLVHNNILNLQFRH